MKKEDIWQHYKPNFIDTKSSTVDLKAITSTMDSRQESYKSQVLGQPSGQVQIPGKLPFTVVFLGDVHWGSVFTDHRQFLKDLNEIRATPNAYVVFMHNLVDNAIPSKYPANMLVNSIPPAEQFPTMQKIIKDLDLDGRVLGALEGDCHEGWSWAATGQSASNLLYGYEGRKFPVLYNGSLLTLNTEGGVEYVLGLWHRQGPFNSNFNKSHSLQQMQRLVHSGKADVEAGAHTHVAEALMTYYGRGLDRKPVAYIRTGSYKGTGEVYDKWNVDLRGTTGEPSGQCVLFYPDRKEMDASLSLETGLAKHKALYLNEMIKQEHPDFLDEAGLL
jgi:hypothetical protein